MKLPASLMPPIGAYPQRRTLPMQAAGQGEDDRITSPMQPRAPIPPRPRAPRAANGLASMAASPMSTY